MLAAPQRTATTAMRMTSGVFYCLCSRRGSRPCGHRRPARPTAIRVRTRLSSCQSCAQLHRDIAHLRWPFCPIYLLHINTYCHVDRLAIPAEIALVETTFWPQLFANNVDIRSMNLPRKIDEHYERYLHLYKRFCSITEDFHDFIHPGDQLPTGYQADILQHSRRTHGLPCTPYGKIGTEDYNQVLNDLHEMLGLLCDFPTSMPMFCTMESFRSTKSGTRLALRSPVDTRSNGELHAVSNRIAHCGALRTLLSSSRAQMQSGNLDGVANSFEFDACTSIFYSEKRLSNRFFMLEPVIITPSSRINTVRWHM